MNKPNPSLQEALENIVWYNGHYKWLEQLAEALESTTEYYRNPFDFKDWSSEAHFIWMLLVGMFGDWGSSVNGGWIEQTKECASFIRHTCARAKGEEVAE